jgi:hypothetical protein
MVTVYENVVQVRIVDTVWLFPDVKRLTDNRMVEIFKQVILDRNGSPVPEDYPKDNLLSVAKTFTRRLGKAWVEEREETVDWGSEYHSAVGYPKGSVKVMEV